MLLSTGLSLIFEVGKEMNKVAGFEVCLLHELLTALDQEVVL